MLWSKVSDISEIVLLKSYQLAGKLVKPKATHGSTTLGFGSVFFFWQCREMAIIAKLRVINKPIFTHAFFLRLLDHLINLFEVKCSFSNVAVNYRGFIYAHNAYNCALPSR